MAKSIITLNNGDKFIAYGSKTIDGKKINGRHPMSNKVIWIKTSDVNKTIPAEEYTMSYKF